MGRCVVRVCESGLRVWVVTVACGLYVTVDASVLVFL